MTASKTIDSIFITLGAVVGAAQIESILGIILLVLQVAWILAKLACKIGKAIKLGDYDEAVDDLKEAAEEVEALKDEVNARK